MKVTYKSGMSWWLYFVVLAILAIVFTILAIQLLLAAIILVLPIIMLVVSILRKTIYTIDDEYVWVQSGFLYRKKIAIKTIRIVKKSHSIESAPALDLKNRIEIKYNKYEWIIVSPKNVPQFITHLQQINPSIEVLGI